MENFSDLIQAGLMAQIFPELKVWITPLGKNPWLAEVLAEDEENMG